MSAGSEIAIIGMSGRFPGARDIAAFWNNLEQGIESVHFFTKDELIEAGEDPAKLEDETYIRANAMVGEKEYFDSEFFGYLPSEVNVMDPELRLFHEECWKAMEDAGYNSTKPGHRVGLFAGAASNVSWEVYATLLNRNGQVDNFTASQLRNARYLNTKISYALNLTGPSVFIDTACSTSLVAVHQACNSLLLGECTMALAGGVSLGAHSKRGYTYHEGMINSKDGHCRAFDAASSGTIIGEGAAVVVLKKLKDAIKDRDHIYAVIKGTCVNNDGNDKVGYTAPSIEGQATVIMTAQKWAKVEPETISYVEAHGTGTTLGDPVEIAGLIRAFNTNKKQFCAIGSVKTNIGHLDAAAGVAGLIKTVLSLKKRKLPPSLHFTAPNPKIDFANSPFYVNAQLREWKNGTHPLRAGVSSFGIGGTNAHVVVEEAPAAQPGPSFRENGGYKLLLFSAKTPWSLQKNIEQFETWLRDNKNEQLADIAYTLQTGRASFAYRQALVCNTHKEAIQLLPGLQQPGTFNKCSKQSPQLVFMFSGQGSQYANMCRDLYEREILFKNQVDYCCRYIKEKYNKEILAVIFPENGTGTAIDNTEFTQPALFIIEYALAQLLLSWGIKPANMIGHSIGEYVAACISGVFSLEDALTLVTKRGELMQQAAPGKMLSVSAGEKEVLTLLTEYPQLSLAAVNSPGLCTISGNSESIESFTQQAEQANYICRPVRTSHAFHSAMMDELLQEYKQVVSSVTLNAPQLSFISNLTGTAITGELATDPQYWVDHLRQTVKFSAGIETILSKNNNSIFVEVGPGKVLYSLVLAQQTTQPVVYMVRHSKDTGSDVYHLLQALGAIWRNGVTINWDAFYANDPAYKVSLPTYSFERTKYIADVDINKLVLDQQLNRQHRNIAESIHISGWQRSLSPGRDIEADKKEGATLIIPGKEKFSATIAAHLSHSNKQVIEIRNAEAFRVIDNKTWEAHHTNWNSVWQHCATAGITINTIIYCATLEEQPSEVNYAHLEKTVTGGYIGLCELAKSLAGIKQDNKINITVVSNHTVQVFEEDTINPLKSCILGPVKIIPVELLHVNCKLVDIPYPFQQPTTPLKYVDAVVNELDYESPEPVIAYRAGQRWTSSFGIVEHNRKLQSGVAIEKAGVYIVTGGFGGMGLTLAANLLTEYKATVILVQRSAFPERNNWTNWLSEKGSDDPVSKRISSLLAMEQNGGRVEVVQANVEIEEEVRNFCEHIQQHFPKINGLIWAAGEVDFGGIIQNRSNTDFVKYLSSKVHGLLLFNKYFNFTQLHFLSLFSSVGNIFYQSKFGQVAYNAANEFMEGFAYYARRAFGIHAFTINWCDWLNVGMTVKTELRRAAGSDIKSINAKIEGGIYPQEGIAAFHTSLQSKAAVTVIYKGNLAEAIQGSRAAYKRKLAEINVAVQQQERETASPLTAEEKLVHLFRDFFGRSTFAANDDFFEQGGDSLKAMTLIARINQTMGSALLIADLYNYPTAAELAAYITHKSETVTHSRIPKAATKEQYVLSAAQKRMYFLQQVNKSSTVYNEFQLVKLQGRLNIQQIENTFNQLIQRHESLRTGFAFTGEGPVQVISNTVKIELELYQARDNTEITGIANRFIRPFDLFSPPLLRAGLISLTGDEHILLVDMHHIITDGISKKILIKDFMLLYTQQELPALSLQYKDYAEWQQSYEQQAQLALQKNCWLNEFADEVAPLDLPADYSRPQIKNEQGDFVNFSLNEQQTAGLRAIATAQGASMFMVLMALYNVLLSKLCNKEDIVIGIPTAGRRHADLEEIIGMFVNTLPVRNTVKGELSFSGLVAAVKSKMLLALDNQEYQYEDMIEALKVTRDTSRNPLFDVMLAFQKHEESTFELPGLTITPYENREKKSKFDLSLVAWEYPDQIQLSFEYSTALFRPETIQRFAAYLQQVVNAVTHDADGKLADINILTEKEKRQLLHGFNNTKAGYPANKTIIDVFETQANKTPGNVAVTFQGSSISYQQLHEQSGKIAAYLKKQGVKPGDLVGVMLPRSTYLIPAVFGILKAGAAYVPIDPQYPAARIQSIIEDAKLITIVTTTAHMQLPALAGIAVTDLPEKWEYIQGNFKAMKSAARPNDLAYVIYTSGSTGKPKGVMIEHHSVLNRIGWMQKQYPITENDVLLQKTPVVFDVSVWELFWWSFTGASLCILKPNGEKEPNEIIAAIEKNKVTTIHFVPAMLAGFLGALNNSFDYNRLRSLKQVFASGEALKPAHAGMFGETLHKKTGTRLINLYGPTEATVDVSFYECHFPETHTSIPIGKPIDNITLHILDKDNQLMPVGSLGELCIAGVGVARGYLNNEPLTNEKFIYPSCLNGERVYRTGDLAKWLPDGNIEYAGRIDHQVKIRGYRIETGEIEYQLARHPLIKEGAVIVKEKEGSKYLVAYYVADQSLEAVDLKNFLLQQLPDYMVPSFFVQLDKLPVTTNGKLDRKALPEPGLISAGQYVAPSGELEEKLVAIWAEVLKVDKKKISVNINFFDIGGDSIKVLLLVALVNKALQVQLAVSDIFRYPSISALVALLKDGEADTKKYKKQLQDEVLEMDEAISILNNN